MEVINGNRVATSDQLKRLSDLDALRRSIVGWIGNSDVHPLEKLIVEEVLAEGSVFTLNTNIFSRGWLRLAGLTHISARMTNFPADTQSSIIWNPQES